MFDQQLTMDGGAEDIAPKHEQPRLFTAPKTMAGQLALDTDTPEAAVPSGLTYRERRERKAERLREWADKREVKADQAYAGVKAITERIPFGQPILVGHHSERGARADQRRIERGMDSFCENNGKAAEMRSRADNIEAQARTAIYSDDPDATDQLAAKVARLEAQRDRIKRYNATCRKGQDHGDLSILTEPQQRELLSCIRLQGYQCKNGRFPSYVLTNLGGNITRLRKRLESLEQPDTGRMLTVKYGGECRTCGETIERGETARYFKRTRELEHADCPAG